jgi:hypothetical protein
MRAVFWEVLIRYTGIVWKKERDDGIEEGEERRLEGNVRYRYPMRRYILR